jgi:manganese transport protein
MTDSLSQATLIGRAILAGSEAFAGRRRGLGSLLPFAGPAVMASVAYMDPGNFATNIQAGARYNYNLLWVVLVANAIAMLFQALSAKLGIVTGRNLAELSRECFPQPVVWGIWIVSEIGAMAPAFVVVALGIDATRALILSQVVPSLILLSR